MDNSIVSATATLTAAKPTRAAATAWCLALRTAAVVVALASGLQITFWGWLTWQHAGPTPDELQALTLVGQLLYHPDHDLPVYLGGIAWSLVLALSFGAIWSHRLAGIQSAVDLRRLRMMLLFHVIAALALVVLPAGHLNLTAGCAGLLFGAAALWFMPKPTRVAPAASGPPVANAQDVLRPHLLWVGAGQIAIVALIGLIVYIPDIDQLVRRAYAHDHFHHIDFYMMAPALAFRHGVALGTSFYTQYGVGWPVVLATLSKTVAPLSYQLLLTVCVVWGCIYFFVLHHFLRITLRSWAWASTGLLLVLLLQLFSGADDKPKWLWPSSTVMRYSMDVFLFLGCLLHARTGRSWTALPIGAAAAVALLLGTDTGLYLALCAGGYLVGVARLQSASRGPVKHLRFALLTLVSFATVLVAGLAIASRGTLWTADFWLGWTESLRIYGNGFSHIPVSEAVNGRWAAGLLLMLMLMCYLFAVSRMLQEYWRRALTPEHLVLGLVAANGLATMLLFIGRSHPFNLTHVSVPFCVLLTGYAADVVAWLRQGAAGGGSRAGQKRLTITFAVLPFACAALAFAAVCLHPTLRNYPNTMAWLDGRSDAMARLARRDDLRSDQSRLEQVSAVLRKLSDSSDGSVGMIDVFDTAYLVKSDLRPQFRYSPVLANLAFKSQVEFTRQQILDVRPEYIVIPLEPPKASYGVVMTDSHQAVLSVLSRMYTLSDTVAAMGVYRLNADTPRPNRGAPRP